MYLPSMTRYLNEIGPDDSLAYAPTQGLLQLRERWKLHQAEANPSLGVSVPACPWSPAASPTDSTW